MASYADRLRQGRALAKSSKKKLRHGTKAGVSGPRGDDSDCPACVGFEMNGYLVLKRLLKLNRTFASKFLPKWVRGRLRCSPNDNVYLSS